MNDSKYEKKVAHQIFREKKYSFEWYLGSYTLLLWFPSYLRLNFDKILNIQTLIITFKPPYLLDDLNFDQILTIQTLIITFKLP